MMPIESRPQDLGRARDVKRLFMCSENAVVFRRNGLTGCRLDRGRASGCSATSLASIREGLRDFLPKLGGQAADLGWDASNIWLLKTSRSRTSGRGPGLGLGWPKADRAMRILSSKIADGSQHVFNHGTSWSTDYAALALLQ
jgi:hypothetical protein